MSESLDEFYESLQNHVIDGDLTGDDLILLSKVLSSYGRSLKADPNKEYFSKEDGDFCYQGVLEGKSYRDVLLDLSKALEKPDEWLKSVRNNSYMYSKETVNSFEEHPKQMEMNEQKTIDKIALKKSRSLVELIKRLEMYVTIHNRLQALDDKVNHLLDAENSFNTEIEDLKKQDLDKSLRIHRLETLAGVTEMGDKDLCKKLFKMGVKQKVLSEKFDVSVRTIKRWVKEDS